MDKKEIKKAIEFFNKSILICEHTLTNGWIPEPPPTGTECLVQTKNNEIIHAYYAGDSKYHFVSCYDRVIQAKVKYWQPLPQQHEEVS